MKRIKHVLMILIVSILILGAIPVIANAETASAPAGSPFSDWEWEVLKLVNRERYNNDVDPLTGFTLLQNAADIRASEVYTYFSHTRPNGESCFTVLGEVGVSYYAAGENIASGFFSPASVMTAWMNSSGHRANILSTSYSSIGVGYENGASVQLFVGRGGNNYSSLNLVLPENTAFPGGTSLDDMNIYAILHSSTYGDCYLPILSEYCTGYDPYQSGTQTVTVSVLGFTESFPITLNIPVPEKPYNIVNTVSGVHIYWNEIEGVQKYGVWRSETGKDGTYKWVANPTTNHFTDISVESGKTYYYKISTMIGLSNIHSEKSPAIGITFISTPDITSRANTLQGVQLGWNQINGATGYAIYRKSFSGNDAWVRVATISGNATLTWLDTSVKNDNGTVYRYTVRALYGTTLSGCLGTGRTMVRLSNQFLTGAAKASNTSIKCSWTTSSRVTGYEVRFLVDGTVYKTFTIGNYKTGVKTFTGLEAGQTYTIQVRTYKVVDGVGSFYSEWSTARTVKL